MKEILCPACLESSVFNPHGEYKKYYYAEQINIFRIRCENCKTTHAIIPSFSLPNTSIGTEKAESYLINKSQEQSRRDSGIELLNSGFDFQYIKKLEKLLEKCIFRAKALFPESGEHILSGLEWIYSVIGNTTRPIYEMNMYCLKNGYNAVFCSRYSILVFKNRKSGNCISHNNTSPQEKDIGIDSS